MSCTYCCPHFVYLTNSITNTAPSKSLHYCYATSKHSMVSSPNIKLTINGCHSWKYFFRHSLSYDQFPDISLSAAFPRFPDKLRTVFTSEQPRITHTTRYKICLGICTYFVKFQSLNLILITSNVITHKTAFIRIIRPTALYCTVVGFSRYAN